jgi:hypothetical protein
LTKAKAELNKVIAKRQQQEVEDDATEEQEAVVDDNDVELQAPASE